jgi:pyrroline-5-carboxylate reductase
MKTSLTEPPGYWQRRDFLSPRMMANAQSECHRGGGGCVCIGYDAGRTWRWERTLDVDGHILLIGFGNMGQALVRGWLDAGRSATSIRVVEPASSARTVAQSFGITSSESIDAAVADFRADVVVLAVKPNQIARALEECRDAVPGGAVWLSIAAGKTLGALGAGLHASAAVVRAMPNTPAAIGRGMTALVANGAVNAKQRGRCADLMAAVGAVAWLDDERHMDAVTAVSGSGPAYVFLLIECLERAALEAGLAPALARQLALATVSGSAAYAAVAGTEPAELRRRVTSPNGTTQAALEVLMAEPGLQELLTRAVRAAAARSRELSAV